MKILNQEGNEIDKLDLGIVEAGTSKEYEYSLYNDSTAEVVELKVSIPHNEVEILSFPEKLSPQAKGILKIKWSPSITLKQGLQTVIKVSGAELYR